MGFSVHEWRFFFFVAIVFSAMDGITPLNGDIRDDPPSKRLGQKGSERGSPCLSWSRKNRGDFMHYKIPGKWDPTKKMMLSTCKTMKFLVLGFKLVESVCCSLVTQERI